MDDSIGVHHQQGEGNGLLKPAMNLSSASTRLVTMSPLSPLSSSSSSSGYSSTLNSPDSPTLPFWSASPWSRRERKDDHRDEDHHCCSLTRDTWRNSNWTTGLNKDPWNQPLENNFPRHISSETRAIIQASLNASSSRDYSVPIKRVIVSVDVEQIGPEDERHHPFDKEDTQYTQLFERKPWGVTTNTRTDHIYVSDRHHHVIIVFGPDGEYLFKFGGFGSQPGQLNRPSGITYDASQDRILVADKDNHRIQAFEAATGNFISTFGSEGRWPGEFSRPWDVAVSKDGRYIAVTDSRNSRIQLFNSDGAFLRQFRNRSGSIEQPKFLNYPRGIAFDPSGEHLFWTDFKLHHICRVDINFRHMQIIVNKTACLFRPSGIEVDAQGNLLVCDTRNNRIRIFRPNGRPTSPPLERVGGTGFELPLDLAVMRGGLIAALDLNGRIRIF